MRRAGVNCMEEKNWMHKERRGEDSKTVESFFGSWRCRTADYLLFIFKTKTINTKSSKKKMILAIYVFVKERRVIFDCVGVFNAFIIVVIV